MAWWSGSRRYTRPNAGPMLGRPATRALPHREAPSTVTVTMQEPPPASPRTRRPSRVERIRTTYGFDDVSLAPGVEPSEVDTSVDVAGLHLDIPILAAAMDAVVDVRFAAELARLGGVAVLNLEG